MFNNKNPQATTIKKNTTEIQIETAREKAIVLPAGNAGTLKSFGYFNQSPHGLKPLSLINQDTSARA